MNIKLEKITEENFRDVIALKLEDHQEKYLPSNLFSIAEASLSELSHARAISKNDEPVGFIMYAFGEIGSFDEDECTIWRFMIDRQYQNKRIGTHAMKLLLAEIKAHQRCKLVDIYYSPDNIPAKKLYETFGFKQTGFRDDGDIISERTI